MKKSTVGLLAWLLVSAGTVQAGLFEGSSTGTFENPAGPAGMVTTGVGTSNFTWGSGFPPSSLGYTGSLFDVNENDSFMFGSLNYYNGAIASGTGANSIDLSIVLDFISPSGFSESFTYDLGLINTPNSSDPNASADIVSFDNTVPSNIFSLVGVDYTLEFLGFGTLSGSGFTIEDSFLVLENASASVDLVGRITSVSVSEPQTTLLLLLGLAGIAMATRKRKLSI